MEGTVRSQETINSDLVRDVSLTPMDARAEENSNIIIVDSGLPQTKDTAQINPLSEQEEQKQLERPSEEALGRQSVNGEDPDKSTFDQYSPVRHEDDEDQPPQTGESKAVLQLDLVEAEAPVAEEPAVEDKPEEAEE